MTPKLKIELPDDERGLSPDVVKRFDRLKRKLERTDLKKDQREATLDELQTLELSPRLARERTEIERGIAETVERAAAHGEEVERTKAGGFEIVTRDGLKRLYIRRRLSEEEYEEGKAYRRDRELRNSDLGSQLGGIGGTGSAHDNRAFVWARLDRAKAASMIGIIDRAVALRCISHPSALNMLRWVAGDGQSISAFGEGRTMLRNLEALKSALDIAASARKAEDKRRAEEAKRLREGP